MCGRYALFDSNGIKERFRLQDSLALDHPNYNIPPGTKQPVITRNSPNKVQFMRWGFVPSWSDPQKDVFNLINARTETLHQKPAFQKAFKTKRCLIPANGFFEWHQVTKQPYFINSTDRLISFAGLYNYQQVDDTKQYSYCIITTQANHKIAPIHHRMPVIMQRQHEAIWLDSKLQDTKALQQALEPVDESQLHIKAVSKQVNNPKNNNAEILQEEV